MSGPPPKQRVPSQPGPPPQGSRKSSQPTNVKVSQRFYDGPTISVQAKQAAQKAQAMANQSAQVAKTQSRKAIATAKRHPWSLASIITTIPFLLTISLLSTVLCPPPSQPQSFFSKTFTSTLGLHKGSPHSELHETLCYPSYIYQKEFLTPYIYPLLDRATERATTHPIYVKGIEPTYKIIESNTQKIWNGPIKPVLRRLSKGARISYLKFVDPHVPYLKARVHALTAPYTTRISRNYQRSVAPYVAQLEKNIVILWNRAVKQYHSIAEHPYTAHASRIANTQFKLARKRTNDAYVWSKPHALKAKAEGERVLREVLGPRAVQGIKWTYEQLEKGRQVVRAYISQLYLTHLDKHLGPHIATTQKTLRPYISAFYKNIYIPYIRPALELVIPAEILSPKPTQTSWSMIADFLPSMGQHPGNQPSINLGKAAAGTASKSTSKSMTASQSPIPKNTASKAAGNGSTRGDVASMRDALKIKIEKQGKAGQTTLKEELIKLNRNFVDEVAPKVKEAGKGEIDREIDYILGGLDKLYSNSPSLTKEQVENAGNMAIQRLQQKVTAAKGRLDTQKKVLQEAGKPLVQKESDRLDKSLELDFDQLQNLMTGLDDLSTKDQDQFVALQNAVTAWKDWYNGMLEGKTVDRTFKASGNDVIKACNSINTDFGDMAEAFKDRINLLKRTATDRVAARDALKVSSVSSASKAAKSATTKNGGSKGPIVGAAAAAAAANAAEYGSEKIKSAASQASAAIIGEETPSGVIDQIKESASSVYDAASEAVHQGTRSAMKAVGATPSPESLGEHVESIIDKASKSAESIVSAVTATPIQEHAQAAYSAASENVVEGASVVASGASSLGSVASVNAKSLVAEALLNLHHATRSIISAAGATPSPEGFQEHLESIVGNVAQGAASVYGIMEENIHHASKTVVQAVGGTPAPENASEHAQSFAVEVSSTVSSLLSEASVTISSVATEASKSAVSVVGAGSSVVHDATRSAISAVGGTPSPETPGEYIESLVSVASSQAGQGALAINHQATEIAGSIRSLLGLEPTSTPLVSSASAYLASLASAGSSLGEDVLASGSSLISSLQAEASTTLHDATRAAARAVGATPTPESAGEYVDEMKAAAESAWKDAQSLVQKHQKMLREEAGKAGDKVKSMVREEL